MRDDDDYGKLNQDADVRSMNEPDAMLEVLVTRCQHDPGNSRFDLTREMLHSSP